MGENMRNRLLQTTEEENQIGVAVTALMALLMGDDVTVRKLVAEHVEYRLHNGQIEARYDGGEWYVSAFDRNTREEVQKMLPAMDEDGDWEIAALLREKFGL